MKLGLLHTHYRQAGGEDNVFEAERNLLQEKDHEVIPFVYHNRDLEDMSAWHAATVTIWNNAAFRRLKSSFQDLRLDLLHVHNTFLFASPAVFYAAKDQGLPVVMTLHNYRLLCPNALLFRDGKVCEQCLGRLPWPGVKHACYRDSRLTSGLAATMMTIHRGLQTWKKQVDIFIALSKFARRKFIEGGIPADKIVVKPNFVHRDPGARTGNGDYALLVGRLSNEKGLSTALVAWERLGGGVPLKIVGDGPLASEAKDASKRIESVEWLGKKSRAAVYALMDNAAFLLFPSECYEGFPMVLAEAFAKGIPVITSAMGSQADIVADGQTGLHFSAGNPDDLATKVEWAQRHPMALRQMGDAARQEYKMNYTAEQNYDMLSTIYQRVIDENMGN